MTALCDFFRLIDVPGLAWMASAIVVSKLLLNAHNFAKASQSGHFLAWTEHACITCSECPLTKRRTSHWCLAFVVPALQDGLSIPRSCPELSRAFVAPCPASRPAAPQPLPCMAQGVGVVNLYESIHNQFGYVNLISAGDQVLSIPRVGWGFGISP